MKQLSLLLFFLFVNHTVCTAQQYIFFLKNNGKEVFVKDSADFTRIIQVMQAPDSASVNYSVLEYYSNNQRKFVGKASAYEPHLVLEGASIRYHPNGMRKATIDYEHGLPKGAAYFFFPDGRLRKIVQFEKEGYEQFIEGKKVRIKVKSVFDSTGKETVINGNGVASEYEEETGARSEGAYLNGLKVGKWTGQIDKEGISFEETYKNGKIENGISRLKSGEVFHYKQEKELTTIPKGDRALAAFLAKNLKMPPAARDYRITGKVTIQFMVEKDGSLTDVMVLRSAHPVLDQAALQLMKKSPKWYPARQRGIPVASIYKVPISFGFGD